MSEDATPAVHDDALTPPTFDVLPLSPETRAALAKIGYVHPTPVQRAVFEPASRGKDLVVQARTGTGKTTAFGLPIIETVVRRATKQVQVLILCPTRELALQVSGELGRIAEGREIQPIAIYGGAPMGRQIEQLAAGAQVVVGTPGRVLDHLRRGTLDPSGVRALILDEADEMLSMGFERELSAILDTLPKERQTLLFSATVPPDIERMARERLREPEFITLSGDAVGALSIEHFVYFVTEDKATALVKIVEIENPESAIVFCNTKVETEAVSAALARAGFEADWLNGDLAQNEREEVMRRTREGKLRFLVCTDVAARGIDISHLTHVINYDFPETTEAYVHRTGRTGRAGRTGTAISLVRPQDIGNVYMLRLTYKIRPVERQIPSAGEMKTRQEADLVAMLSEAFASKTHHPDDLLLARRLLTHDRAEAIVAGLLRDHLGERQTAAERAAEARRAKAPTAGLEVDQDAPTVPRERERARRDDRGPRDRGPRGDRRDDRGPPRDDRGPRDRGFRDDRGPRDDRSPRDDRGPLVEAIVPAASEAIATVPEDALVALPHADRPQGDRPQGDRPRGDRRDDRRDRRPRREDRAPAPFEPVRYSVSDVEPLTAPSAPSPSGDLSAWHPPEEEGDDQPILAAGARAAAAVAVSIAEAPAEAPKAPTDEAEGDAEGETEGEGEGYVVVFVDVGRRDGARPADFQRVLRERGGISRRETGRIRVRDKHALVAVRREVLDKAITALTGAEIAGRTARAEQARDQRPSS